MTSSPDSSVVGDGNPATERATLAVTVYGIPAPQGSKRHVGKGVMVESSAKVKPWREAVKWAAREAWEQRIVHVPGVHMGPEPFTEPVNVTICFTLPKPASAPKQRRTWPAKRPDLDKLIRSTFDALGDAGVWADDAQVVHVTAHKEYPGEHGNALPVPGARIWVSAVAA